MNRRHGGIPEYMDIDEAETTGIDVETGEVTDGSFWAATATSSGSGSR